MLLPDEVVEGLRPVFAGKNLITHAPNLNGPTRAGKQKNPKRIRTRSEAEALAVGLTIIYDLETKKAATAT